MVEITFTLVRLDDYGGPRTDLMGASEPTESATVHATLLTDGALSVIVTACPGATEPVSELMLLAAPIHASRKLRSKREAVLGFTSVDVSTGDPE